MLNLRKKAKIQNYAIKFYILHKTLHGKVTKHRKKHIQESQEGSPFPTGHHKAARSRHDIMTKTNTNNKKDPEKKHRPDSYCHRFTI